MVLPSGYGVHLQLLGIDLVKPVCRSTYFTNPLQQMQPVCTSSIVQHPSTGKTGGLQPGTVRHAV
jgi:hypothetical protein